MRIRYSVSVDDMVEWNVYHQKHSPAIKSANRRQQFFFVTLVVVPSVIADLVKGRFYWTSSAMVWLLILFLFMRFVHIPLARSYARWVYSRSKNRGVVCEHTMEIVDDGILETTDVNQNKAFWSGIESIQESSNLGMIYVGVGSAYVIPRRRVIEGDYDSFMLELKRRFAQLSPMSPSA